MDEVKIQAQIVAIEQQRNWALTRHAEVVGENAVLNQKIKELTEQLEKKEGDLPSAN